MTPLPRSSIGAACRVAVTGRQAICAGFAGLGATARDAAATPQALTFAQGLQQPWGLAFLPDRIQPDGQAARGNPALGPGAKPEIWSFGHRNPQGAALHPGTGELWLTEHGPQGGDELNIARAGQNYGWPERSYGCNYGSFTSHCEIGNGGHAPEYVEPLTTWIPRSIAPSGLCFYDAPLIPQWRGNLFVGALYLLADNSAGRALRIAP